MFILDEDRMMNTVFILDDDGIFAYIEEDLLSWFIHDDEWIVSIVKRFLRVRERAGARDYHNERALASAVSAWSPCVICIWLWPWR